jgi:hypothetical protein
MNLASFDGLSRDERDHARATGDATAWPRDHTRQDEANSYALPASKGMQLNLTPGKHSFRPVCSTVLVQFPDLFPPDLVKLANSVAA